MSLGERLRRARNDRGLSIDDIAQKTFIRPYHLEAIERDDYSEIPASRLHYFIRDYARMVDLDPEEAVAAIQQNPSGPESRSPSRPAQKVNAERKAGLMASVSFGKKDEAKPKKVREPKEEPKKEGIAKGAAGAAAGRTLGSAGGSTVSEPTPATGVTGKVGKGAKPAEVISDPEITSPPPAAPTGSAPRSAKRPRRPRYGPIDQGNPILVRGLMTVAGLLILALVVYYLLGGFEDDGADTIATEQIDSTDDGSETMILSRADGDEIDTTTGEVIPAGDSLVLQGRFTAEVWYNVSMDNNREETGILDSGAVKEWRAAETFTISLGNAGGLDLTLNGKPLGTLGRLGETVQKKKITAEGLPQATTTAAPASSGTSSSTRRRSTRRRAANREEEGRQERPQLQPTAPQTAIDED